MRYYVGSRVSDGLYETFKSATVPTETSHGQIYSFSIGPFKTKRGADWMARYGKNNPHAQTVAEVERLAKKKAQKLL